jgi:hypothetical protein
MQAIDSSPSKHIVVMGMGGKYGGIIEYKYDPKKMTLKRIWVAHFPVKEATAALAHYKKLHEPPRKTIMQRLENLF